MKKLIIAAALLSLVTGTASAQTNVEIWGRIDAKFVKKTDQTLAINNGDNSKLGFRATEDLGDGWKAQFNLENRFLVDTGQLENNGTRPFWQGRSTVGLTSSTLGSFDLGRWVSPIYANSGRYDAAGLYGENDLGGSVIAANFDSEPTNPGYSRARISNGFFYSSPVINGIKVMGAVGSKENNSAAYPGELRAMPFGLTVSYLNGPLETYVGFERNSFQNKNYAYGLSYNFDIFKLFMHLDRSKYVTEPGDRHSYHFGISVPVNGVSEVFAIAGQYKSDFGDALSAGDRYGFGYRYHLSKRTTLYTSYQLFKRDAFAGAPGIATSITPANALPVKAANINTIDFGIEHYF